MRNYVTSEEDNLLYYTLQRYIFVPLSTWEIVILYNTLFLMVYIRVV